MTKKKTRAKIDWRVAVVGLVCIMLIQVAAMYFGIDGTFRAICAALIAGIVGVAIPNPFK